MRSHLAAQHVTCSLHSNTNPAVKSNTTAQELHVGVEVSQLHEPEGSKQQAEWV